MSSLPILGYWDFRAVAEPIRYLLRYAGVEFEDKRYPLGEGSSLKTEEESIRKYWFAEKFNLGLDFPNLPYYIDGDVKLTQSLTIMRYLARKYGLFAEDEESLLRQELVEQSIAAFRWDDLINTFIDPEYNKFKDDFINKKLPVHLQQFSTFLGDNEWFSGKKLTFVDFIAYETFDWIRLYSPTSLEQYPNLGQFLERFEKLPPIAAYLSSPDFKSWPLFGPYMKDSFGWTK